MKRLSLPFTFCLVACMPLQVSAGMGARDAVHAAADDGKPKADKKRLFKAGGIGCVAGGAVALFTGKKDKALGACAAGAAVGASASYVTQQREHAEQAADAARAAGMKAEVVTKTETVEGKQEAVLDSLRLNYNPTDMKRLNSDTRAFLDKFAGLLNKSSNGLTVVFQGADKAACQVPIVELAKRGALSKVTVDDRCGSGEPVIVVTPVPDVR